MKIRRNMIIWADLKSGNRHVQSGIRPCLVVSCDVANQHSPVFTVIPGTAKKDKKHIPVHFEVTQEDVKGHLKNTTRFLPEQICTISEQQIIQIAGRVSNPEILLLADKMMMKQLGIGDSYA